ncbi:MAG: hypothetical protein V3R81_11000 [Gammaproteobacteria bacterium]
MDILKSKKFQAALAGLVVVVAEFFVPGLAGLPVQDILMVLVAYILGQGLADLGKEREIARQVGVFLEEKQ